MDIKKYMAVENEKPLDNIVTNGGFAEYSGRLRV